MRPTPVVIFREPFLRLTQRSADVFSQRPLKRCVSVVGIAGIPLVDQARPRFLNGSSFEMLDCTGFAGYKEKPIMR